jgi:DNA-binding transcriptional MerR regulator
MEQNMQSNLSGTGTALATTDDQQSGSPASPASPWRPMESYTVQQAAALTGLSEHTLRYYERIGLIKQVQQQETSGHRRYGPADLAKLETLACLRATGIPIDQMRRYFELRSDGAGRTNAAAGLQALLSAHLQELHRRMAALQQHMKYVERKIEYWRAVEAHDEQAAASIALYVHDLVRATVADRG